ncbi:MAG: diguanylate cyclase, partial [Chloroflexi bacterium]|nr:diguanylate cyclase [Chloroflexota bacterium]
MRIRLALALAAAAILPVAAMQAVMRAVDATGPGVEPSTLLALLVTGALLVGLVVRMARRVLEPAAELDASRGRLRDAYEEVREFALVDGLTGLGNHRAFQEAFEGEISRAQRYRQDLSLVLLDLDEFKLVNDAQGHAVGDSLLAEVGRLIRGQVRRSDRAFRIGGDEFALILPQTAADGAQLLARRLLAAGLELRPDSAYQRPISFSAGVSSFPDQTRDREQLRTFADSALYRGKRAGRTTVTLADPALDGEQVDEQRRAVLSAAIAKELAQRSLQAVYQPIIHLESGRVIGFEGLTRTAPGSTFSNPGALFAAAEVSGRVVELDLACLATTLAGAAEIPEPTLVTVNVSPRTLEAPEFGASRFLAMVASSGIAPSRVIL